MSRRISVGLSEAHEEYLSEVRDEESLDADAAAVRAVFDRAMDADARLQRRDAEVQRLESELQQRDARIEELRSELAAANRRIDDVGELVEAVEAERSLTERRARAGVLTRAKWWFTGMDDE
jgi:peptidoglycan hydrolase CwlO-like protein